MELVKNYIDACNPNHQVMYRARPKEMINTLVIHRFENCDNIVDVARFLMVVEPKWTDGHMGYHFAIKKDGTIEQGLPLLRVACGAIGLNHNGIHIAGLEDFRVNYPTIEMQSSFDYLINVLTRWIGPQTKLVGHTEGGSMFSKWGKKVCPGKKFDCGNARKVVAKAGEELRISDLEMQFLGIIV